MSVFANLSVRYHNNGNNGIKMARETALPVDTSGLQSLSKIRRPILKKAAR